MRKFIFVLAAVAALLMSCQPEEEKAGSLSGEGYKFNFTITPGGFDSATKGDATVGWTVGEKVYVFFKPEGGELLGDSYAEFTYTGSGWNPESYVAPGALGSSGKMAAVYVPYFDGKSPVYTDSKWTFDSGDVYYSCASGADYTVNGGTVRGTLSMKIPDGYVQFSIASAAEGDELACNMIDGYEDVTLSSDLVFSTTPVSGSKMTGHADNGKVYFWGRVNGATATECEFTLTTEDGDVVLTVPAENVFKNNAFNIASSFEPETPDDVLPGEFSVSATKKVHFSKGNLYYDGSALNFEASQNAFNSSYESSHVSHFTWSSTVADAVGESNNGSNLFCDENHKVSVNGSEAIYYTLSKDEWTYLFDNHSKKWAAVNGVNGYVIAPDGFVGTLADSYTDDAALAADNLVFLPAAGFRDGSFVGNVGAYGYYWSSSAVGENDAYYVLFLSNNVYPGFDDGRSSGHSVRLVTNAAVSTVPVESVGLNKTATTIAAGATETLTATVLPETATDKSVTWSSSKESVATVDNTGKVTAVATGEATITVTTTDGSKTATCTVTVTEESGNGTEQYKNNSNPDWFSK